MSHNQRYGELKLNNCLTENHWFPWGYSHPDGVLNSSSSYEEERFAASKIPTIMNPSNHKRQASTFKEMQLNKRLCDGLGLQDVSEILVEVGTHGAQWRLHENLLIAKSGFAKAAMTHDVQEKADRVIKMPEARPDSFDLFATYIYKEKLEATSLNLDDLIGAYILADYVDCPAFADLVFEEIYAITIHSFVPFTKEQILLVLSNTLADQPLHILLLDQVGHRILQNRYNFESKDDQELLQPVMNDLLRAIMRVVNEGGAINSGGLPLPIDKYSMHVSRHISSKDVPNGPRPAQKFPGAYSVSFGTQLERNAVWYVMKTTGATEEAVVEALEKDDQDIEKVITLLKPDSSQTTSMLSQPPSNGLNPGRQQFDPGLRPAARALMPSTPNPATPTPQPASRGGGSTLSSGRGIGIARGRGRGAMRGGGLYGQTH